MDKEIVEAAKKLKEVCSATQCEACPFATKATENYKRQCSLQYHIPMFWAIPIRKAE